MRRPGPLGGRKLNLWGKAWVECPGPFPQACVRLGPAEVLQQTWIRGRVPCLAEDSQVVWAPLGGQRVGGGGGGGGGGMHLLPLLCAGGFCFRVVTHCYLHPHNTQGRTGLQAHVPRQGSGYGCHSENLPMSPQASLWQGRPSRGQYRPSSWSCVCARTSPTD